MSQQGYDDRPCRFASTPNLPRDGDDLSRERRRHSDSSVFNRHLRLYHKGPITQPAFLQEIRSLQKKFEAKHRKSVTLRQLSEEELDKAFGKLGTWSSQAALPEDGWLLFKAMESPFTIRELVMWPQFPDSGSLVSKMLRGCGAAALTSKGYKGKHDRTLNQDNLSISRLVDGWEVFAVFDGHGPDGHWPSARAARSIPCFLQESACSGLLKEGKVESALKQAFDAAENDLEKESIKQEIDLQVSGTSATVVLRNRTKEEHCEFVWVAVVGDSRAVLFDPSKGSQGFIKQTTDHSPENEIEKERIEKMGGEIEVIKYDDGYISRRVNIKGKKFPGLGMTRALGDCVLKDCGVISEPEIVKWSAAGIEEAYVLACSDGVWEFIESDEAVEILTEEDIGKAGPHERLEALLKEARSAWHKEEGGEYTDDITMLLFPLAGAPVPGYDTIPGSHNAEERPSKTCETCLLS